MGLRNVEAPLRLLLTPSVLHCDDKPEEDP